MKHKIITFFIAYFPIVLSYLVIYGFWYLHEQIHISDFIKENIGYYRIIIHHLLSFFIFHLPLVIIFLIISLFKSSLFFFKSRRKHFIIAFLWWTLLLLDPVLRWFMD